jgi:rod shape determining protein RodA
MKKQLKPVPKPSRKMALFLKHHYDPVLLGLLLLLCGLGLGVLYSASNANWSMVGGQAARMLLGFFILTLFSYIPPQMYQRWAPSFFIGAVILLVMVLVIGHTSQGAKRWLNLGFGRFQPSEFMKLAMPIMLAYYLGDKSLPPNWKTLSTAFILLMLPVLLVAKQPDLGTAILILMSGGFVIFLAGLSLRIIIAGIGLVVLSAPVLWHFLHQYQKNRIMTLLNPERDPLGTGYHIIQSKIAIGSGGLLGKGYLHGTQSHLQFLPAHATDFIFAVISEEFGLLGCILIITVFIAILTRCLIISMQAQTNFNRLLAGSLCLTFIFSSFINIGMVIGLLPVVGVPLPLVSYGGSSILTMMASFGIIMSIQTHRKLWSS